MADRRQSVLSRSQRDFIRVDTKIDPLIIDRCADAFDALLRDDRDGYMTHMSTAIAQMGFTGPIPARERPTAVDIIKTIIQHALADQWHCSFKVANQRLKRMLSS